MIRGTAVRRLAFWGVLVCCSVPLLARGLAQPEDATGQGPERAGLGGRKNTRITIDCTDLDLHDPVT